MNKTFMKLSAEKRKNIINTAIREFAQKGYTAASTDSICNAAGISKGTLFYYIKNKKNLFC
ncbi:TetR/AcrR family transcriptional regulator [Candidatus Contubernalis alkaliaceticus]|uniref:TetR/AcrR family transcriptional regulator n=1 Tax=Candidatus Contubernalis alkaliaceticus TaxID=338645 RepID=UPI001F4C1EA4|nr:TetR/AcrR family transcriptional regulator [Candidatus Contubernalis alkalaceticus]UNC92066.1 TetR/AcrR family transcriptional regulator [Candidatus Contubernalis alkalaceticus]